MNESLRRKTRRIAQRIEAEHAEGKMPVVIALVFILGMVFGIFGTLIIVSPPQRQLVPLPSGTSEASVNILAVKQLGEQGVMSKAEVEIRDGKGRILFNTNPFVEPDTQYSVELAAKIAEQYTQKSLAGKDVIYSVSGVDAQLIGGPSAGAAMAAATIAAILGKKIKSNAAITGTIEPTGLIGEVSGIMEKATAAGEAGIKLLLVPKGESVLVYYEQQIVEERQGAWVVQTINYVPKALDLVEYAQEKWGMEVKEVGNIEEVVGELVE